MKTFKLNTNRLQTSLLLASLLFVPAAFAQDTQAAPPAPAAQGAPPPPMQGGRHDFKGPKDQKGSKGSKDDRRGGDMRGHDDKRGGMDRLLPPGPWWRNADTAKAIGLSTDQQKHIDELFLQNRVKLIDGHAALEKEQLMLEPLLNANPVDQGRALAQISKIADERAELEKADAKMLLSIRGVLTADQWTKLQAQRGHGGPRGPEGDGRGRQGGPRGPMGQGGPQGAPAAPPAQ